MGCEPESDDSMNNVVDGCVSQRFEFGVVVEAYCRQNVGTVVGLGGPGAREPSSKLKKYKLHSEDVTLFLESIGGLRGPAALVHALDALYGRAFAL